MQRKPKSQISLGGYIKRFAKIFLVAEFVAFGGSYFVWARMNRNQQFRGYMHDNFPWILEGFYKTGEYLDPVALKHIREVDAATWAQQKSQSN